MKSHRVGITALLALFLVVFAKALAQGQVYNVLHSFTGGADGANPYPGLVRDSAGNLYGTAAGGGFTGGYCSFGGCGVVFKLEPSGKLAVLYSFTGGADGAFPHGLIQDSSGNLYGTTLSGGQSCIWMSSGCGVVFSVDPTTGKETVLHTFTGGTDGWGPGALMLMSNGILYGTTVQGGAAGGCGGAGCGVIFRLKPTTGDYSTLYTFAGGFDGGEPNDRLIRDAAGNLYGTTSLGGIAEPCGIGCGVVFKVDSTGKETTLYAFRDGPDGGVPVAGLVRDSAGNLYGTTLYGGTYDWGVVYTLDISGNEKVLHNFTGGADGATPDTVLDRDSAGNLYGTANQGGSGTVCGIIPCGVLFKLDAQDNETVLHNFGGAGGAYPSRGRLLAYSDHVYGTTSQGGAYTYGVVYRLTIQTDDAVDYLNEH